MEQQQRPAPYSIEAYRSFQDRPEFRQLSFEQQVIARSHMLRDVMQHNPDFANFTDDQKLQFVRQAATSMPRFESDAAEDWSRNIMQRLQDQDDDEAYHILTEQGMYSALDSRGMISRVSNRAARSILDYIGAGPNLPDEIVRADEADTEKFNQFIAHGYLGNNEEINERITSLHGGRQRVAAFGANLLDMVPVIHMGMMTTTAGSAMMQSYARQIATNHPVIARRIMALSSPLFGVPKAIDAIETGASLLARDYFLNTDNSPETISEGLLRFGQYSAFSYGVGIAMNAIFPLGRAAARVFSRHGLEGAQEAVSRGATDNVASFSDRLRSHLSRSTPAERTIQMSDLDAIMVSQKQNLARSGSEVFTASDDVLLRSQRTAQMLSDLDEGWFGVGRAADGSYQLADVLNRKLTTFASERELTSELAYRLTERVQKMAANSDNLEEIARFVRGMEFLEPYYTSPKNILTAVDGLSAVQRGSTEYKNIMATRTTNNFLSATERGAISGGEARALQSGDALTVRVAPRLGDAEFQKLAKNQSLYNDFQSNVFERSSNGDGLVVLRNPATDPEAIQAAQQYAQGMKARGAAASLDDLTDMALIERGFDGIMDGQTVRAFFPGSSFRYVSDKVNSVTGRWAADTKQAAAGSGAVRSQAQLRASVRTDVEALFGRETVRANEDLILDAATSIKGDVSTTQVSRLTRLLYDSDEMLTVVKRAERADGLASFSQGPNGLRIEVPSVINDASTQYRFIESFLTGLNEQSQRAGKGPILRRAASEAFQEYKGRFASPFGEADQLRWLQSIADNNLDGAIRKIGDNFELMLPGSQSPRVFNNLRDLNDAVIRNTIDASALRADLAQHGLRLKGRAGNYQMIGAHGQEIGRGATIGELLESTDYRPQRLPGDLLRDIHMDHGAMRATINGIQIDGHQKSVLRALNNFEDYEHLEKLKRVFGDDTGDILLTPAGTYEIRIPKYGAILEASDVEQARRFINQDWNQADNVALMARHKGLDFSFTPDGNYQFVDVDNVRHVARNAQELERIMQDYPDLRAAPRAFESMADGASIHNDIDGIAHGWRPQGPESPRRPRFFSDATRDLDHAMMSPEAASSGIANKFRYYAANTHKYVEEATRSISEQTARRTLSAYGYELKRKGGQYIVQEGRRVIARGNSISELADLTDGLVPHSARVGEDFIGLWRQAHNGVDQFLSGYQGFQKFINETFTEGGRLIDSRKLTGYFDYILSTTDETARAKIAAAYNFDALDMRRIEQTRDLFGRTSYDGLANVAGISESRFIQDYLPIKRFFDTANADQLNGLSAQEILNRAYQGNVPQHIKGWFMHARSGEDVVNMFRERNIYHLLTRYNMKAHQQLHLNGPIQDIHNYLRDHAQELPYDFVDRITHWENLLVGGGIPVDQTVLRQLGGEMVKRANIFGNTAEATAIGGDMMQQLYAMQYFTTMSFRPWIAIRNMQQIFTMGSRLRSESLSEGLKVAANAPQERMAYYRSIGAIPDRLPITNPIREMETFLGRAVKRGLRTFQHSDEFTRFVMLEGSNHQFNRALQMWQDGILRNKQQFLTESGITQLAPGDINRISQLLDRGAEGIAGARDAFSTRMMEDAMFMYGQQYAPKAFTSSQVGRLFGQFGTYTSGWTAQLHRMFQYGTPAQRAGTAFRFARNSAALWGAFSALGVDAYNFLPWTPVSYTGGPLFNLGVNVLRGTDTTSWRGQQARQEALRDMQNLVPGSLHYNMARRAMQFSSEGKPWLAAMALSGAPIRPDLR